MLPQWYSLYAEPGFCEWFLVDKTSIYYPVMGLISISSVTGRNVDLLFAKKIFIFLAADVSKRLRQWPSVEDNLFLDFFFF